MGVTSVHSGLGAKHPLDEINSLYAVLIPLMANSSAQIPPAPARAEARLPRRHATPVRPTVPMRITMSSTLEGSGTAAVKVMSRWGRTPAVLIGALPQIDSLE